MSAYINTDHLGTTRLVANGQTYVVGSERDARNLFDIADVVKSSRAQQLWDPSKKQELVEWEERLFAKHQPMVREVVEAIIAS